MFELNGILYAGSPKEMLKIKDAKITGNMMMLLTFSSGEKRVFDAKILKGDVFKPLENDDVFRSFEIVHGAVTWLNQNIDCAPEYMYANSYAYDDVKPLSDKQIYIRKYAQNMVSRSQNNLLTII